MAGKNSKVGNFATIQEIRDAKKKAEKDKQRRIEKDRKELAKNKKKKGKK